MSKISKVFDFDRELFISKVYERALKNSLKDTVENLKRPRVVPTWEQQIKSTMIDRELEEDSRRLRSEVKVLLLGDFECRSTVVKQMMGIHQNGYTVDELARYVLTIKKRVLEIIEVMVSIVKLAGTELGETVKTYAETLSKEIRESQPSVTRIILTVKAAKAVQGLWASEKFRSLFDATDRSDV
jgi:guanine nucleotide-binding protein G(i) subunit alpha